MSIDYKWDKKHVFYETEIKRALDWLYRIRDNKYEGWAWVQFIHPNEQNTAEVIYAYMENEDWFKNDEDKIQMIVRSINYWLLDTSHPQISIDYVWVLLALQRVRECEIILSRLSMEKMDYAIDNCLNWLYENVIYESAYQGVGWGDNSSEIPNVIRSALAVMAINREIEYDKEHGNRIKDEHIMIVEKVTNWLLSIQNSDGGWGNLDDRLITQEYQRTHSFDYKDLKYQCDSNAASTGYVMLALQSNKKANYSHELKNAFNYLKSSQMDNGGWSVFTEIGIRDNERYTFRHFSSAWAIQGILVNKLGDYRDECIIHGFEYLSMLQDSNYGGWKSSPDADNYTWSTCNALITINMLKKELSEVRAKYFLNIVWDWWNLKKKDANYSFKIGKITFAFNSVMALTFCIIFSIMITLLLIFTFSIINPLLINQNEFLRKFIYSAITIINAFVLGLPWIVYVKNRFKSEVNGWIDSIGWVYGIITGFVLVLYQFIMEV